MIPSSIHLPVNLGNSHWSCPQFGYRFLHWCSQMMYCLKRTNSADEIWQWWKFCESQETVMWSCLWLESKQDSRLSSGKKHQVDFQSSCPVISWGWCIRSVRKVMKALTKEEPLDDEGLLTLICEVEAIINSWSTTKVSDDPTDPEALMPNHLLLLRSGPTLPPGWFSKEDNYPSCRWKQVQHLANVYWRCWIREYLPTLQERRKWANAQRNFSVNNYDYFTFRYFEYSSNLMLHCC